MKKVIEIEVDETTISICESLGLSPKTLFEKVQQDLIGTALRGNPDDTMLLHLYLAQSIANEKKIDRSAIEDFLSHIIRLKAVFDMNGYSYLMDEVIDQHESICKYCEENQLIKIK